MSLHPANEHVIDLLTFPKCFYLGEFHACVLYSFYSLCSSCFNGGTCVDGINTFTCLCLPGFTGSYCQHDINECDSKPCLNGGTCQDSYGAYKCTCPHGYTGLNCQVRGCRVALATCQMLTFRLCILKSCCNKVETELQFICSLLYFF